MAFKRFAVYYFHVDQINFFSAIQFKNVYKVVKFLIVFLVSEQKYANLK